MRLQSTLGTAAPLAPGQIGPAPRTGGNPIGTLLMQQGLLGADQVRQVLGVQAQTGRRFGDVARELGLLTAEQVDAALLQQFDYIVLRPNDDRLDPSLIAAFLPGDRRVEEFRRIRSQILLQWPTDEPIGRVLTVVGPSSGDGRSFTAANLAIVFAQLGQRTVLIDADLRVPVQHDLFRLPRVGTGLSSFLAGRRTDDLVQDVAAVPTLSVLPAGPTPPNPQELLAKPELRTLLEDMKARFDWVIIDTPAADVSSDFEGIAAHAGGTILCARAGTSKFEALRSIYRRLVDMGTPVIGTILHER